MEFKIKVEQNKDSVCHSTETHKAYFGWSELITVATLYTKIGHFMITSESTTKFLTWIHKQKSKIKNFLLFTYRFVSALKRKTESSLSKGSSPCSWEKCENDSSWGMRLEEKEEEEVSEVSWRMDPDALVGHWASEHSSTIRLKRLPVMMTPL